MMRRTLCTMVLAACAAALYSCSASPEPIEKQQKMEERQLETVIIDNEYVERSEQEEAVGHYRRGEVFFRFQMFEEAFQEYWQAMELDKRPLYLERLGISAVKLKRLGDARYFFEESIKADSTRTSPVANLAFVDLLEKKYGKAEEKYRSVLMKEPDNITINHNLGQTILLTVFKDVKEKDIDPEQCPLSLDEAQAERLREARRYFGNVVSLPLSRGGQMTDIEQGCKSEARMILEKIDQALARYSK